MKQSELLLNGDSCLDIPVSVIKKSENFLRGPQKSLQYRTDILTWAGIAQWHSAGLRTEWSGVRDPAGAGNFLLTIASRPALGPIQHPIQCVPWTLSLGVKWPVREADHSPPSSAEVKEWMELYLHSPNTPSWRGAQLKHRDSFTFYLFRP
jgi:hypothetical protein